MNVGLHSQLLWLCFFGSKSVFQIPFMWCETWNTVHAAGHIRVYNGVHDWTAWIILHGTRYRNNYQDTHLRLNETSPVMGKTPGWGQVWFYWHVPAWLSGLFSGIVTPMSIIQDLLTGIVPPPHRFCTLILTFLFFTWVVAWTSIVRQTCVKYKSCIRADGQQHALNFQRW